MVPNHGAIKRRRRPDGAGHGHARRDPQWLDAGERRRLGAAIEVAQRLPFDEPGNAPERVAAALTIAQYMAAVACRYAGYFGAPTRKIIDARYSLTYALSELRATGATPGAG